MTPFHIETIPGKLRRERYPEAKEGIQPMNYVLQYLDTFDRCLVVGVTNRRNKAASVLIVDIGMPRYAPPELAL